MKLALPFAIMSAFAASAAAGAEAPKERDTTAVELGSRPAGQGEVVVPAGTNVPLVMINSVSSKHSQPGDPVYLESVYPVVVDGKILIPAGTHVSGSVLHSKRPGRVKGRGQLQVRLEQMILPNGVIRSLMGRPGALDGRSPDNFDRETGEVRSQGTKGEDAQDVATIAAAGASIGSIAGAVGGRTATGLGVGAISGAAVGITKVLLTRGPEAMLDRGTHIEMVLEQDLEFTEDELQFDNPAGRSSRGYGRGPDPTGTKEVLGGARELGACHSESGPCG